MTEELDVNPSGESLTWNETWVKALMQPSVETYQEIINDPNAGARRAYVWMAVCSLWGYVLSFAVARIFGLSSFWPMDEALRSMFFMFLCGIPIAIFASVFGIMITAGFSQLIASLLGGTGTYTQLLYAFAAYLAPLSLITYFIGSIPGVNCLALPLGVFLNVTAIKAVHKFNWGRAVASSFSLLALFLCIAALVAIVVLVVLGSAIDTVFTGILRELGSLLP